MKRHEFLAELHRVLKPRTYLEIGVEDGASLGLSRAKSIGIDPFFTVVKELRGDIHLVRSSSDEFFGRKKPLAHFDQPIIDLAFIDGMHLSEYLYRDLMNVEKFCTPGSVILLDDMLPRTVYEAARDRFAVAAHAQGPWAGDVYKVLGYLRKFRKDLIVIEVDTKPTGTLLICNPDRNNRKLSQEYFNLLPEMVSEDPQTVPPDILNRNNAWTGQKVLNSLPWAEIIKARSGKTRHQAAMLKKIHSLDLAGNK